MATLEELHDIVNSSSETTLVLRRKINAAISLKAQEIVNLPTVEVTPGLRAWANTALADPKQYESIALRAAVSNAQLSTPEITAAQITGASETALRDAVNLGVEKLLGVQ